MQKKILITARDYSSGLHALPFIMSPFIQQNFNICLVFGEAAHNIYEQYLCSTYSITYYKFFVAFPQEIEYENSLNKSICNMESILSKEKPDVLFSGISGTGIGVDEIAMKVCKGSIPIISYQDFWGHINPGLGSIADKFLLIDSLALTSTKKLHSKAVCEVVGYLKYDFYLNFYFGFLKKIFLKNFNLGKKYLVFIGQPLSFIEDYISLLNLILDYAKKINFQCYYLPHPSVGINYVKKYLPEYYSIVDTKVVPKDILILRSNKVITCYSTYIFDLLMMKSYFSFSGPDMAVVNMYASIEEYKKKFLGALTELPISQDIVYRIEEKKDLCFFLNNKVNSPFFYEFKPALNNVNNFFCTFL